MVAGRELRWGRCWVAREGRMKGRRAGDGTCLSPWCRRCHLRYHCWNLPGCCSNSEKDPETEDDDDEAAKRKREKVNSTQHSLKVMLEI